jgi:hypothetical protein
MKSVCAFAILGLASFAAQAIEEISIIPTDDGYVQPPYVTTDDFLIAGENYFYGYGVIEFPFKDIRHDKIDSALIAVNPYGLPLHALVLNVYGYESKNGRVDLSDFSAGVLLGQWELPADLDYAEETFFDVTAFLRTVKTKFVGFRLESPTPTEYDLFSSLEYNYGTPSRLIVTVH